LFLILFLRNQLFLILIFSWFFQKNIISKLFPFIFNVLYHNLSHIFLYLKRMLSLKPIKVIISIPRYLLKIIATLFFHSIYISNQIKIKLLTFWRIRNQETDDFSLNRFGSNSAHSPLRQSVLSIDFDRKVKYRWTRVYSTLICGQNREFF
jgi:hypothetical protein